MEQSSPAYYKVLGVTVDSSVEEIKQAYRKLAMVIYSDFKIFFFFYLFLFVYFLLLNLDLCSFFVVKKWHPDKWTKNPSLLGEAKSKFQQIQEAYSGGFFFF